MQNGDITISMDQAMLHRNDYTDDYLHSRANAMQVKFLYFQDSPNPIRNKIKLPIWCYILFLFSFLV